MPHEVVGPLAHRRVHRVGDPSHFDIERLAEGAGDPAGTRRRAHASEFSVLLGDHLVVVVPEERPLHRLHREIRHGPAVVSQVFAGDAVESRLGRSGRDGHRLEEELPEGEEHDPHGQEPFDILAHRGVRVGHQRRLRGGLKTGHGRRDVLAGPAASHGLEVPDGFLQLVDAGRRQEVALVVQDLLGLFGQVARLPIAFPEQVAE